MLAWLSRRLFHPLWDLKDRSVRLRTLQELERSQWLPQEVIRARQWTDLLAAVRDAYEHVPFYRRELDRCGIAPGDIRTPDDFRRLPVLTKRRIQLEGDALLSRCYPKETLGTASTGGSTGKSLKLFFDKRCEERRNAAAMRADRWAGWKIGEMRAAIWGNPPAADTFKKKVRLLLHDRVIYLDTMKIDETSMAEFVQRWRRYRPTTIFGHAHSIFIFARFVEATGVSDVRPRAIISTSMMLLPNERRVIERVFGCPVTDRYGCEEVGLIACECERHDGMHLNMEHVYVETLDDADRPVPPGTSGRVVVTDLINRGMPLIRYAVEDVAVLTDRRCGCGRGLPLMEKVTGRVADFLVRGDGSLVAGVSLVERTLTAIPGIDQMQIVQEPTRDLTVNLVRASGYTAASEAALREELRQVFGEGIAVRIEYRDRIPQERSGKYRFAICKVARP